MVHRPLNVWNSVLGWSAILLAGAVYAVLTLSPRVVTHDRLSRQQLAGREQLDELYIQTQQMERVVETLESDPGLLEEIARADWNVEPSHEETIAVDSALQADLTQLAIGPRIETPAPLAYIGWLAAVSRDESLRGKLMLAAIALSLIAILSAPRERQAPT